MKPDGTDRAPVPDLRETRKRGGVLLVVGTAVLWSTSGVFIKLVSLDPFQLCFWRSALALVVLATLERPQRIWQERPLVLASLCYTASIYLFVVATRLTTAANAILLTNTSPALVLVLAHYLLGERVTWRGALAVLSCFAGMAIFFLEQASLQARLGDLLGIGAGAAFALVAVLMRMKRDAKPIGAILLGNLWVVGIGATVTLIRNWGDWPGLFGFALSRAEAAGVVFLGVFQLGLSYFMLARAIRRVRALDVSLLLMIEPLLNPIWVMIFAAERPSVYALAGGSVILTAVVTYLLQSRRALEAGATAPD